MLNADQRIKLLEIAARVAAEMPGHTDIVALAKDMERYVLERTPTHYSLFQSNPIPLTGTGYTNTENTNGKS